MRLLLDLSAIVPSVRETVLPGGSIFELTSQQSLQALHTASCSLEGRENPLSAQGTCLRLLGACGTAEGHTHLNLGCARVETGPRGANAQLITYRLALDILTVLNCLGEQ